MHLGFGHRVFDSEYDPMGTGCSSKHQDGAGHYAKLKASKQWCTNQGLMLQWVVTCIHVFMNFVCLA